MALKESGSLCQEERRPLCDGGGGQPRRREGGQDYLASYLDESSYVHEYVERVLLVPTRREIHDCKEL